MDTAMADATMDIDIDLGDAEIIAEAEAAPSLAPEQVHIAQESPAPDQGDRELVPHKIHIRGVDDLSTANLEEFALEHYPRQKPSVEWIDDTSANFVFEDAETARKALAAYTSLAAGNADTIHALQLREAKTASSHPETRLQARTAVVTDRKKPRAREASRYYLLHPEEDPLEKKRSQRPRERRHRRRSDDDEIEKFDASMYDDNNDSDRVPRRYSRENRGRDRSASPGRAMRDIGAILRGNREKELFPNPVKTAKNKDVANNLKKELFPMKAGADEPSSTDSFALRSDAIHEQRKKSDAPGFNIRGSAISDGDQGFAIRGSAGQKKSIKELFPESTGTNAGKELFGGRSSNNRRNKAADLFG